MIILFKHPSGCVVTLVASKYEDHLFDLEITNSVLSCLYSVTGTDEIETCVKKFWNKWANFVREIPAVVEVDCYDVDLN